VSEDAAESQREAVQLIRAAQLGDRAAFGQIVWMFQGRLYNALFRLLGNQDDAAELCQEAFTRALENVGSFRGEAGPYTWIFRIATNLALTSLRNRQRRRTFSAGSLPGSSQDAGGNGQAGDHQADSLLQRVQSTSPTPAQEAEQRDMRQQVVAALGRIDPEQRALLVMRDVDGMDYQQMAQVLEVPIGTVKSRLFRARLALREELVEVVK
jgi:RNA polymerase sigma-70 factor (ECF subfamily)